MNNLYVESSTKQEQESITNSRQVKIKSKTTQGKASTKARTLHGNRKGKFVRNLASTKSCLFLDNQVFKPSMTLEEKLKLRRYKRN